MKGKLAFFVSFISLILVIAILIIGNNLYNLKRDFEALRGDNTAEDFREVRDGLNSLKLSIDEKRVIGVENPLLNEDIEQFMRHTKSELNRIEDLLNKVGGINSKYGVITDLEVSGEISLIVRLAVLDSENKYIDTDENMKVTLDKDFTPYMVTEINWAPISREEFIEVIQNNLKNGLEDDFTFKIVNGKVVHIYQGYRE